MDVKENLAHIEKNIGRFAQQTGDFMQAFRGFVGKVHDNGALDEKTTELIVVALAVGRQCENCLQYHCRAALQAGASRAEILAAVQCAILMGGGPALMEGQAVIDILDQLGA
ncbi:MAG: carboxymuconolactone decarboxylase family protein [Phycisphaerae bacterium]